MHDVRAGAAEDVGVSEGFYDERKKRLMALNDGPQKKSNKKKIRYLVRAEKFPLLWNSTVPHL